MGERAPAGSELVRALEAGWSAIRREHSGVPAAVIITGAGSGHGERGLRLGHFAASRWRLAEGSEEEMLGEVFIGGEGLQRGGAAVLGTLLHEAAHAHAARQQVKDTSRQGRYHNRRFKALAEQLGLEVEHHPQLGWSLTTLPSCTARRYGEQVLAVERALFGYRESEHQQRQQRQQRRPAGRIRCVCGCGRSIHVPRGELHRGEIVCGACGSPFTPHAS